MNAFQTTIKNIATGKGNLTEKRAAIVQLGIPYRDACYLVRMYNPANPRSPRAKKFTYTFGVEIECFLNRNRVLRDMDSKGVAYRWDGYYSHTNGNSDFRFKSDSSIARSNNISSDNNAIECVSPVLQSKDGFDTLKKCCDSLYENGAQVNKSTGLHVHIGAGELTDSHYCNIFVNYYYLQGLINSFLAPSRRNSRWARRLESGVLTATTKSQIASALNNDRYHAVNAEALTMHGTVEFRQHQGSVEYTKISNWVKFLAALVEWSKDNRLDHNVTSLDDCKFLTKELKEYYNSRIAHFQAVAA